MTVSITISGSSLLVTSPYNSKFVDAAKRLGGRWRGGAWVLDARDEARVRALCCECYGTDGTTAGDVVTLRIEWRKSRGVSQGPIEVYGRTIARATGRDSDARLGDGIAVLDGGFGSGGSVKNWTTSVREGTVVLVRDFPRVRADELLSAQTEEDVRRYSIEDEVMAIDRPALHAERERLVARIAEIDALLGSESAA